MYLHNGAHSQTLSRTHLALCVFTQTHCEFAISQTQTPLTVNAPHVSHLQLHRTAQLEASQRLGCVSATAALLGD